MNHLKNSASPYLLQHADNPVNWYPWNEEALDKARREDKPILVSIGYSTCHWCHVMERESFEDPEVADYMNALFVCIKVDREERPDLDALYMEACQVMTGTAGWPLNIFLTPDLKPYHGGTYFPPEPEGELPSWMETLNFAAYNFYENREAVEAEADKILARIKGAEEKFVSSIRPKAKKIIDREFFLEAFRNMQRSFDTVHGGFGEAPKFPNLQALEFLQRMGYYFDQEDADRHLDFSLRQMLSGGIFDQVGGGIARYATMQNWLVPHFEKMLYDNALLIDLLAQRYKQTKDVFILRKLQQTIGWVLREMAAGNGGFFSGMDADTDGEEGAFYTWTKKEFDKLAGKDAGPVGKFWHVTAKGNWEGKNILWHKKSPSQEMLVRLERVIPKLLKARNQRTRPHRDEKILLNWNALTCRALVTAYEATAHDEYKKAAKKNIRFLIKTFVRKDGRLNHVWTQGKTSVEGMLTDYSLFIDALLAVFELDFDKKFLAQADELTKVVLAEFIDKKTGLFFATPEGMRDIPLRRKEINDSEIPNGNAVMVHNLMRLALLLDRPEYSKHARKMMAGVRESIREMPLSFPSWLNAAFSIHPGPVEIAIVGKGAAKKALEVMSRYIPDKILVASAKADDSLPLLRGKPAKGEALIYVCKNYTCKKPVARPEEMTL